LLVCSGKRYPRRRGAGARADHRHDVWAVPVLHTALGQYPSTGSSPLSHSFVLTTRRPPRRWRGERRSDPEAV